MSAKKIVCKDANKARQMKSSDLYLVRCGIITEIKESKKYEQINYSFICKKKDFGYKDIFNKSKIYENISNCVEVGDLFATKVTPLFMRKKFLKNIKKSVDKPKNL